MPAELKMAKTRIGHQNGAGQSGVGDPRVGLPDLQDRVPRTELQQISSLALQNSWEGAQNSLGGEMCQGCTAGDGGNQDRSPKVTFHSQKTQRGTCQGKQSSQVSTDTHTHPLPDTQSIQKIDFFHAFKNIIPLIAASVPYQTPHSVNTESIYRNIP